VPWNPLPTGSDGGPEPLGQGLDRVVRRLGGSSTGAVQGLFGQWADIVGERVANHCTPAALRDDTLVVTVDDPAWATQLRFLETEILSRVKEALGVRDLTRMEVRVKRPRG
jgi:predicted nucleic acid-binding Zn ribbon protein